MVPLCSSSQLTRSLILAFTLHMFLAAKKGESAEKPAEEKARGKVLPLSRVDLLICHDFMWSKWKRELGYVYSTINLSFKPKDLATLKL